VIFEPVDFIAKLAALVPKPRVNLTRFHGVFAPNSKHRARVTPAKRGKGGQKVAEVLICIEIRAKNVDFLHRKLTHLPRPNSLRGLTMIRFGWVSC
jgi:hypothetical protein